MTDNWMVRKAKETDIPFIYDSWLESYKRNSHVGKSTSKGVFFENYRRVIDSILSQKNSHVCVACLPDNQDVIIGYLVYESNFIAHFSFVKEPFRLLGVAKSLFHASFDRSLYSTHIICTHKTFDSDKISRRYRSLKYNPFILYKQGDN